MKIQAFWERLRWRAVFIYLLCGLSAVFIVSCSKQKNDLASPDFEPTELERNSEIYGLLKKETGACNVVYGGNKNIVSTIFIAKVPIRGKHSRAGLLASQQAAIWEACANFAGWLLSDVATDGGGKASRVTKSQEVKGLRVIFLRTDIQTGEVTAILGWKAIREQSEIGTLPQMTVSSQEESSQEVAALNSKDKKVRDQFSRRIYIDGVLVIKSSERTSTDENGKEESTFEYTQFYKSGKPNLEETMISSAKGSSVSTKIEGALWEEAGKKSQYSVRF